MFSFWLFLRGFSLIFSRTASGFLETRMMKCRPSNWRRSKSSNPRPEPRWGEARSHRGTGSKWVRVALVVAAAHCRRRRGGLSLLASRQGQEGKHEGQKHGEAASEESSAEPTVQVVKPQRGGMERTTSQPGTVRAFRYADLYSKVSGFVQELNVDRGDRVKKGQVLAVIYDPERDVAVEQADAALDHAYAEVDQAKSAIETAQASVMAAKAEQKEAQATLVQRNSERDYQKEGVRTNSRPGVKRRRGRASGR